MHKTFEVFIKVVETGSFSKAAEYLSISAVMVGKYIAMLEKQLNTVLIERTTRSHHVTEAGQLFYERAKIAVAAIENALQTPEELCSEPNGILNITAPTSFGAHVIAPLAAQFQKKHHQVKINLDFSNRRADLVSEGFDIAIRIGSLGTDSLITRYLCEYEMVIAASPNYLIEKGLPASFYDLQHHRLLTHTLLHSIDKHQYPHLAALKSWDSWASFTCNDGHALKMAALSDNGIIFQPKLLLQDALKSGKLIQLFEEHPLPTQSVHVLYTSNGRQLAKIKMFIEFLQLRITHYVKK